MAAKTLAALPVLALAGWSGNAALVRMQRGSQQPLEFATGSMDDTIMESLETGDLVFFTRKLSSLQPLAALHTLTLRRQLDPRFDHCGWIYVDRLGRKFVVEETLDQVQCRPYSARILASEASEIAVLPLKAARSREMQDAAVAFVTREVARKSRVSLRQFVTALVDPAKLKSASRSPDDDDALIAFPAAGEKSVLCVWVCSSSAVTDV